MTQSSVLQFELFSSAVDAAFWQDLAQKKLNDLRLSTATLPIRAYYSTGQPRTSLALPARLCVPGQGLTDDDNSRPSFTFPVSGSLMNVNMMQEFKSTNKNELFQSVADKIWTAISDGSALRQPSLLLDFFLLTFADLKSYKFYYWLACPAFMPQPDPWLLSEPIRSIGDTFSQAEITALAHAYQTDRHPFFLVKRIPPEGIVIGQLSEWNTFYDSNDERIVGFADPSCLGSVVGWPLRNLLALMHTCYGIRKLKILCYRETPGRNPDIEASRILVVELPSASSYQPVPKAVGWEKNAHGKLAPRVADLGPLMDPIRLSDTAVDLNLKLMRWRIVPDLNLEKIKSTKCLLLGAGTLGCYVARSLLGWGVRHITFVDNGRVSFSNPVRQPLYEFDDCKNGGAPKAETAAKSVRRIQPTVTATGHDLSIPMPGHPATSDDELRRDIQRLTDLIESHDAIFLLTDSRESRWYPTLLAAKTDKPVINAALGFDTFLAMRHGSRTRPSSLGCYFCNDIVAPTDSLSDRTLDQQCTVTRPGLAAIAGACAVELLVSLLQHPDGVHASPDNEGLLGRIPHQIRGFLSQFQNMLIVGQAYERCAACSERVLTAYHEDPFQFMKKVLKDPEYLEQVSGLLELKTESEALLNQEDWAADEDDF